MDGTCSMHRKENKWIQYFGWKTLSIIEMTTEEIYSLNGTLSVLNMSNTVLYRLLVPYYRR